MALSTSKSKGSVDINGGGTIKAKEVTETIADISPADTAHDIGYIEDSGFTDDRAKIVVHDETGTTVRTLFTTRSVMVNATMLQAGSTNLVFAKETADRFYQLYKYNGIVNGFHQEMFFGIGNITPKTEVKWGANAVVKTPFEFEALKNDNVVSIGASAYGAFCSASASSTTITIPAGEIYTIVNTSVTAS